MSSEISNVCKEINYMASYSGGEFDTMWIDHLSWTGNVKTMFNTSLKKRKIYLENQTDYDLNNSLKLGELKMNHIKRIIKRNRIESGNYKEEKEVDTDEEVETDEEYFRKKMQYKGEYLFHPHHLNYYRCKLGLKFGVRPTKNNNCVLI
jgi:hypothetical protein